MSQAIGKFLAQQAVLSLTGAYISWTISNSVMGALAGSCVSLIFDPETSCDWDTTKKILDRSVKIFGSFCLVRNISQNVFNVDVSVLTPLFLTPFSIELANLASLYSVASSFFALGKFINLPTYGLDTIVQFHPVMKYVTLVCGAMIIYFYCDKLARSLLKMNTLRRSSEFFFFF